MHFDWSFEPLFDLIVSNINTQLNAKTYEMNLLMKSLVRKYISRKTLDLFIGHSWNIFSYFWRFLWLFLNGSDDIKVKKGTFNRNVFYLQCLISSIFNFNENQIFYVFKFNELILYFFYSLSKQLNRFWMKICYTILTETC